MARLNSLYTVPFRLADAVGTPISGAVVTDFSRKLVDASGVDQTALLSITEVVEVPSWGRYYASAVPNSVGQWKLWLQYSSGSVEGSLFDQAYAFDVTDAVTAYESAVKINTPYVFAFQVVTAAGVPVSGAESSDFSYVLLNAAGTDKSSLLTVTELVETPAMGRYYASATPDSVGSWSVWLQYGSGSDTLSSYSDSFEVTVGEVLASVSTSPTEELVTRCRTQYDQLAVGMSQYISYRVRTDGEWVSFITDALDAFNGAPPIFTGYTVDTLPSSFRHHIKEHAVLNCLLADEIMEASRYMAYNDNGISFSRDRHGKYSATRASLMAAWMTTVIQIKKIIGLSSLRPAGIFSSITGFPRSLDRSLRGTRMRTS